MPVIIRRVSLLLNRKRLGKKATLGNNSRCWGDEWNADERKNPELSPRDGDIRSPGYFGTLEA
jgi:hypothetical protein